MQQQFIDRITDNPRRLFLVDGLGALLTAFSLGVILVRLERYFGMPQRVLYCLSAIACIYGVYSIYCSIFIRSNWRPFLKVIAIANLLYCCLTMGLVFYFYQRLTIFGLTYFLLELIIIVVLAIVELKVASSKPKTFSH